MRADLIPKDLPCINFRAATFHLEYIKTPKLVLLSDDMAIVFIVTILELTVCIAFDQDWQVIRSNRNSCQICRTILRFR